MTRSARGQLGWAFYDFAVSAYATLIVTFVFAPYFQQGVVGDAVAGQALWSTTLAVTGLALALLAPFVGALTDAGGARKPWIFGLTMLGAIATGLLWFVEPDPSFMMLALVLVVVSSLGVEFGQMISNALLPDLTTPERIGRLSGWAWGLGFVGGLAALLVALAIVLPETPPFGLDAEAAEPVRLVGPLVAVWLLVFSLPLFAFTPDRPRKRIGLGPAIRDGLRETGALLRTVRRERDLARFLISNLLYNNGLLTLFGLGGIYAAGEFGMSMTQVLAFGILLNVTSGLGAFGFGFVDDRIGSRTTVLIAVGGLTIAGAAAILARDEMGFWVAGAAIGVFVGPAQAASRSFIARIAPPESTAGHFGLLALSGRVTAFLGPAAAVAATAASGSQRIGMATILLFLAAGFALLLTVRERLPAGHSVPPPPSSSADR